ncbi:MAG: glycoside hydrolase family 2 protein [Ruminococcaceae bacterium]|nr:glycoside hydrolase family 2 protein [Oscillospiraceae bacterium]
MHIQEIKTWQLNFDGHTGLECQIPCSVYGTLIDHNLIDHPYIGANSKEATSLSELDSEFFTTFEVSEDELAQEKQVLRFEGLDTLCSVYLNDALLAQTDNMHRTYEFDVTGLLVSGSNRLTVKIQSPLRYIREMEARYPVYTNPDTVPGAAHIRKASYMFGWDWAPTLPDMGIHGKVTLLSWSVARLKNASIRQYHEDGSVRLEITPEWMGTQDVQCTVSVEGKTYPVVDGTCTVVIDNPRLWYPNGMGDQPLYDLDFAIIHEGKVIDTMRKTIGLRTIELRFRKDEYGKEFCFVVNGEKIFAKGANYIPADSLVRGITPEKTKSLIDDAAAANFNMLRVWGGGLYPSDEFYDYCDRAGIIVWQDFMFGCIQAYLRAPFEANIVAEAIEQAERLRHHASLGLFCGNNEMEISAPLFGFDKDMLMVTDYVRLYERLLPDICEKYAPETFYLPSSPTSGGGFDDPGNIDCGDSHYWGVYFNLEPYEDYKKKHFRFLSEFGMNSFANIKTAQYISGGDSINACSPGMSAHQTCPGGTNRMLFYNLMDHLYSSDFATLVYSTQLVQASTLKCAVEHMRRNRERCTGTLYWQFNDSWPSTSWSTIDYFGRWKAGHYAAKRFYAPVLLSLDNKGTDVLFNVSNESRMDFSGDIHYRILDAKGHVIFSDDMPVSAPRLGATDVCEADLSGYLSGFETERFVEATLIDKKGEVISRQTLLFVKPKEFRFEKPTFLATVKKEGDVAYFTIGTDCPAFGVELDFAEFDLLFCDNYFDLTDTTRTVSAQTDKDEKTLRAALKLRSVWDIR